MDSLSPDERARRMSLVRAKDTKPEMLVRRLVHSMGYRYRLHARDLPGTPDLVFRSRRKIIFVHGCFWHRHNCAMGNRVPKSRVDFWEKKLAANRERDARVVERLETSGWSVLVIWECEVCSESSVSLERRIDRFLSS